MEMWCMFLALAILYLLAEVVWNDPMKRVKSP